MTRCALVAGTFGQHDPGDSAALDAVAAALPGWALRIASTEPASALGMTGHEPIRRWTTASTVRTLSGIDAVVLLGGTLFKALPAQAGRGALDVLQKAVNLALAARAKGIPFAMIGTGAAPLPTLRARALARELVRAADLLVLADEDAASALAAAGAPQPFRIGADPAWLAVDPLPAPRPGRRGIVVAVSGVDPDPHWDAWAAALRPVADAGHDITLMAWQRRGVEVDDARLMGTLAVDIDRPVRVLPSPSSLTEARDHFAGAAAVLGSRVHTLIAASAGRVPFVAVDRQPKCRALALRLGQPVVHAGRPEEFGEALTAACAGGTGVDDIALATQRRSARESLDLLRLLLTSGEAVPPSAIHGLPLAPRHWVAP